MLNRFNINNNAPSLPKSGGLVLAYITNFLNTFIFLKLLEMNAKKVGYKFGAKFIFCSKFVTFFGCVSEDFNNKTFFFRIFCLNKICFSLNII